MVTLDGFPIFGCGNSLCSCCYHLLQRGVTRLTEFTRETHIGLIALQCKLAEMEGYSLKKKMKRYNKIAQYHMMHCAGDYSGRYFMGECILACSDDPLLGSLHSSYDSLIEAERWMYV